VPDALGDLEVRRRGDDPRPAGRALHRWSCPGSCCNGLSCTQLPDLPGCNTGGQGCSASEDCCSRVCDGATQQCAGSGSAWMCLTGTPPQCRAPGSSRERPRLLHRLLLRGDVRQLLRQRRDVLERRECCSAYCDGPATARPRADDLRPQERLLHHERRLPPDRPDLGRGPDLRGRPGHDERHLRRGDRTAADLRRDGRRLYRRVVPVLQPGRSLRPRYAGVRPAAGGVPGRRPVVRCGRRLLRRPPVLRDRHNHR
jgi:hypothetical protein